MNMAIKLIMGVLFFCISTISNAEVKAAASPSQTPSKETVIQVDLFLTKTCPHCHKADDFFQQLEKKEPWLVVNRYFIDQDKSSLHTFFTRLQEQNAGSNYAVPAIFFCDARWSGFSDEKSSGKVLLQALNYCHHRMTEQGKLSLETIEVMRQWGNASQIQIGNSFTQGGTRFLFIAAMADALSPCSWFCLMIFLVFLWIAPQQRRQQLINGIVFILALGVMHYLQQAHSAWPYQNMIWVRLLAGLTGLLLLFYTTYYFRKIKGHGEEKYFRFIPLLIVPTVWMVQLYQQTCPFNIALVFEQWLIAQGFSNTKLMFYHLFYQAIYLLPLCVLLMLSLVLSTHGLRIGFLNILKTAGILILLLVGVLLVIYPQYLASVGISILVLIVSLLLGWLIIKRERRRNA